MHYKNTSPIIQGLMRIENISEEELYELIKFDLENGVNFFDVSDVYGNGACEEKLGRVLKKHPELRQQMIIQTKVGIIKDPEHDLMYFDLSFDHIMESCNDSLKRMNLDYIDYYLLHRPDIFFAPREVAKAFATLNQEGKVAHFGVSNFPHEAIKYLTDQTNIPIEVNQLQLGLGHLNLVREVLNTNMDMHEGCETTGELFFYMKRYGIALQCWSPYQVGFFEGSVFKDPRFKECNDYLEELATKYKTSKCAIATSFLLMLGKNVQVITGATDIKRVKETIDGTKIRLTKPEWYTLYRKTGNFLP